MRYAFLLVLLAFVSVAVGFWADARAGFGCTSRMVMESGIGCGPTIFRDPNNGRLCYESDEGGLWCTP